MNFAANGIVFHFLFLTCTLAGAKQYFRHQPESDAVNPGGTVILTCLIADKSFNSECSWQHNGLPVLMERGKYEWSGDRNSGDCSIKIMRANINYDLGSWVCQVTRSSYDSEDGLSSEAADLVVRQPPEESRIFKNDEEVTDAVATLRAGQPTQLRCESNGGNPAPVLTWYLNGIQPEHEVLANQINTTLDDARTLWRAVSTLDFTFSKEHNGQTLRCSVHHEALPRKVRVKEVVLNVQYPPSSIKLSQSPNSEEVEENVDTVAYNCSADGNPKPDIIWRKIGTASIFQTEAEIRFEPARLKDSGTYICWAKNTLGSSDEISVRLEVRYPPREVKVAPSSPVNIEVGGSESLTCSADGHPAPRFEWLQIHELVSSHQGYEGNQAVLKGIGDELVLDNVTYNVEGIWRCAAFNTIKGEERRELSDILRIDVSGKPIAYSEEQSADLQGRQPTPSLKSVGLNEPVKLTASFCSDPPPTEVWWEWGSSRLEAGQTRGRMTADQLQPLYRKDCYSSTITVDKVAREDQRIYYLAAKNGHGEMKTGVKLSITDPVSMGVLIGLVVSGLVLLVGLLLGCVICKRYRRCCFSDRKGRFQPQDMVTIERREDTGDPDRYSAIYTGDRTLDRPDGEDGSSRVATSSSGQSSGSTTRSRGASASLLQPGNGIGREVTYQGHAGKGRPVPAPFCSAPPPTTSGSGRMPSYRIQDTASLAAGPAVLPPPPPPQRTAGPDGQILPRKVRGTPTMYADLQFPSSSNFGSMKRRREARAGAANRRDQPENLDREADYVRIRFNPRITERAEL